MQISLRLGAIVDLLRTQYYSRVDKVLGCYMTPHLTSVLGEALLFGKSISSLCLLPFSLRWFHERIVTLLESRPRVTKEPVV